MNNINCLSLKKIMLLTTITILTSLLLISCPFVIFLFLIEKLPIRIFLTITLLLILFILIPYIHFVIKCIIDIVKNKTMYVTLKNPVMLCPYYLISLSVKRKFFTELFTKDYTLIIYFKRMDENIKYKLFIKKSEFEKSQLNKQIKIINTGNYEIPISINDNNILRCEYYKFSKTIKNIDVTKKD